MKLKDALNVWGGGQILAFSGIDGKTDFNNGLVFRTSPYSFAIDIKLPGTGKIKFRGKPSDIILAGDFFIFGSIAAKGAFIDDHHFLIAGDCEIEHADKKTISIRKGNKVLLGTRKHFKRTLISKDINRLIGSRAKWINGISIPKVIAGKRRRTLYKAFSQMKTQIYSPEGNIKHFWTTPDRWPHRQMWLWDSVFHAIGLRHIDIRLAREAILALFDAQKKAGMMPHMMNPSSSSDITQPPIIALGIKLLNETSPSPELIKALYPKLKKYIEWDLANRDSDGVGLCEWKIEGDVNCRCGESGLDNSPRFDCAAKLDATDFNAYLALECEIMAEFAKLCGHEKDVVLWEKRHKGICRLINERLWSDDKGFYFDYNLKDNEQSDIYAISGFLPLICGAPSKRQAERLVAHLNNSRTFGTPFRIPSIARCDEKYYSKDMWRGPVWISTNWLVILGLKRYGYLVEAERLAEETMVEVERNYFRYGTFFEFYDDRRETNPPNLLRKGQNSPETSPLHQVLFDYGWTATLYADMAFSRNS